MHIDPDWAEKASGTEAAKNPEFTDASRECQDYYDKIRGAEPAITDWMKSEALSNGYAMHGLDFSVKTVDSIEDKFARAAKEAVENKGAVPADIDMLRGFKDIIRYTFIVDHKDIPSATNKIIGDLESGGFAVFKVSNMFANPAMDSGYRGMHIGVVSPEGFKAEIQVHSEQSQTAKDIGHVIYEEVRKEDSPLTDEEKEARLEESRAIYEAVEDIPDIDRVESHELSREEVDAIVKEREDSRGDYLSKDNAEGVAGSVDLESISKECGLTKEENENGSESDGTVTDDRNEDNDARADVEAGLSDDKEDDPDSGFDDEDCESVD